jgi:hypothetical protein
LSFVLELQYILQCYHVVFNKYGGLIHTKLYLVIKKNMVVCSTWLWNIARGMSGDEVKARTLPKSHSCGKTFPGPKALKTLEDVSCAFSF